MKPKPKKQRKHGSPTSPHLSEQKRIETFVKEHWFTIAAMAWDGYQTHGRGFLLFDAIPPKQRRYYPAPPDTPSPGMQELTVKLATYDPAKEIILVFHGPAFSGAHVVIEAQEPTPPEAYARYHQKQPVTSIAPEDAKALTEIINPYSELLIGLDKTTCHPLTKLPHPKDTVKHAILQFAATIQEEKVLVDVGMMYSYLGLFLPDEALAVKTEQEQKDTATQQSLALHDEFVAYVEQHNPHFKQ